MNKPPIASNKRGRPKLGPDLMPMNRLHGLLKVDEGFRSEFEILSPQLRKITSGWAETIPRAMLSDAAHQDAITIRDLNAITDHVAAYVEALNEGEFSQRFEGALDGIALVLKKHAVNPGWATLAFANAFETAQNQLYAETRKTNGRVFPAALRCLMKILVLTLHLLNRRDHELNDVTPHQGIAASS